jgi:hypothetical protein
MEPGFSEIQTVCTHEGASDSVTGFSQAYGKWIMLTRVIYRQAVARTDGVITPKPLLCCASLELVERPRIPILELSTAGVGMPHSDWRWTERQMMIDDNNEIRSSMEKRLADAQLF